MADDITAPTATAPAKSPTVWGLAYSGAKFKLSGSDKPTIVDLAGLTSPPQVPLLANHENKTGGRLGMVNVAIDATSGVRISGAITSQGDSAADVIAQAKAGDAWQMSIGADIEEMENVRAGQKRVVNGREQEGPFTLIKKATLKEISVVPVGADTQTFMRIAASAGTFALAIPLTAAFEPGKKKDADGVDEGDGDGDAEGGAPQPMGGGVTGKMKALLKHMFAAMMEMLAAPPDVAPVAPQPEEEEENPMSNGKDTTPVDGKRQLPVQADGKSDLTLDAKALGLKLASAEAEITALRGKVEAREASEAVAKLVADAEAKLAAGGFALSADVKSNLAIFAAKGKDLLDAFIATYEKVALKDPPKTITAATTAGMQADAETDGILGKLAGLKPEDKEKAKSLALSGRAYIQATHSTVTLEEYVRTNLKAEGIVLS